MAFTSTWFPTQAENEALTAVLIAAMLSAMGVLTPVQTIVFLLLAVYTLPCEAMPNPNIQEGWTELPNAQTWDGIPYHDFRVDWYQTIKNSLGSIAQDGWTLLQCALDQDVGGPAVGGNAQQQQQSAARNHRVFASIMRKISPKSWLYRYVTRAFGAHRKSSRLCVLRFLF